MTSKEKAIYIARMAADKKADGILVLDIKDLSSISDYIVICHGASDRQVQAIAESIQHGLKKRKVILIGSEGVNEGRWALLDYGDVVVHIFYEPVRDFYNLEGLWAEAPRLKIS